MCLATGFGGLNRGLPAVLPQTILEKFAALYRDKMHQAAMTLIIINGLVPRGKIVPHGNITPAIADATLNVWAQAVIKKYFQKPG